MNEPPDVIVYTDGACSGNPGPGGWGTILKHPGSGKIRKLSGGEPDTTNNRMELMAVIEGLGAIDRDQRWRVHVVSDSTYVIKGLSAWLSGWVARGFRRGSRTNSSPVKNADLWQQLHELIGSFDMSYELVRGHAGHPENEECDRLAVAATQAARRSN